MKFNTIIEAPENFLKGNKITKQVEERLSELNLKLTENIIHPFDYYYRENKRNSTIYRERAMKGKILTIKFRSFEKNIIEEPY